MLPLAAALVLASSSALSAPAASIDVAVPAGARVRISDDLARMDIDGVVAVGDVPAVRAIISRAEVSALPDEGFIVRSGVVDGARVLAVDGRGEGRVYGAYRALELLGARFWHPLAPELPRGKRAIPDVNEREAPSLHVRNIHLHTMHPLELTDLLEGFPVDNAPAWSAQLPR
ncbi:MAG TPA: hypothetical protein VGO62_04610, partial [Myxococcota bacterium]